MNIAATNNEFLDGLIESNGLNQTQAEDLQFLAKNALSFQQELTYLQANATQLTFLQIVIENNVSSFDPAQQSPEQLTQQINEDLATANIVPSSNVTGFVNTEQIQQVLETNNYSFLSEPEFLQSASLISDRVPPKRVENFVKVREQAFNDLNKLTQQVSHILDNGSVLIKDTDANEEPDKLDGATEQGKRQELDALQINDLRSYLLDIKVYRDDGGEFPAMPDFIAHEVDNVSLYEERQDPLARAAYEININLRFMEIANNVDNNQPSASVDKNIMFVHETGIKSMSTVVSKISRDEKLGEGSRYKGDIKALTDVARTTSVADKPENLVKFAKHFKAIAEQKGFETDVREFKINSSGYMRGSIKTKMVSNVDGQDKSITGEVQLVGYGSYKGNKVSHDAYEALRLARNNYGATRIPEGNDAALFEARYDQFVESVQLPTSKTSRQLQQSASEEYKSFVENLPKSDEITGKYHDRYAQMTNILQEAQLLIHSQATQALGTKQEQAMFANLAQQINNNANKEVISNSAIMPVDNQNAQKANQIIQDMKSLAKPEIESKEKVSHAR